MKLSGIVLTNFKQYYGAQEFTFSIEEDKPVTIIHGENGAGKSSLLGAFRWCLYDQHDINDSTGQTLLNTDAAMKGESAEVQVVLEYEEEFYRIIRKTNDGLKTASFKIFEIDRVEGHNKEISQPNALVAKILPRELSKYFFFAGEGVADLSRDTDGQPFVEAVRSIYGFVYLEKLISDLEISQAELVRGAKSAKNDSDRFKEQANANSETELNIGALEQNIARIDAEVKEHRQKINEIRHSIRTSGNNEAAKLQKEIVKIEGTLKASQLERDKWSTNRRSLVGKYGWSVFASELVKKYASLKFQQEEDSAWLKAPFDEYLLDKIISERVCLCGRTVEEDSDAEKSIKEKLKSSQTSVVKERKLDALGFSVHTRAAGTDFLENLRGVTETGEKIDLEIRRCESEIEEQKALLQSVEQIDIQKYLSAEKELDDVIKSKERSIGSMQNQLATAKSEKNRAMAVSAQLSAAESKLSREQEKLIAVSNTLDQCKLILKNETETSLVEVNQQLSEFLQSQPVDMLVEVLEDYSLSISNTRGPMNPSTGESLMVNLTFVSTLISAARRRIDNESSIFASGSVAPFVIDAPFGEMDTSYSGAVVERLVTDANQLILLISSSHWNAVKDQPLLNERIGKEYVLIKNVVSGDENQGAKTIELRGQQIDQIKLGANRNSTEPLEIFGAK